MKRSPVVYLALAVLASCASTPELPPKSGPEEVELYNDQTGIHPPEGYLIIGEVTADAHADTPEPEMQRLLLTEAAGLGADAVLWRGVSLYTTQGPVREEQEVRRRARGIAIYWP